MWQLRYDGPAGVMELFLRWLDEGEGQDRLKARLAKTGELNLCLLDLIKEWVQSDLNIVAVPSYEVLLGGVLMIVQRWIDERSRFVLDIEIVFESSSTGEGIVSLFPEVGGGHHDDYWHTMLERSTFESARARALNYLLQYPEKAPRKRRLAPYAPM